MKTHGAGVYDDVCTMARETTQADGAIVMILGGNKGSGFSVQVEQERIHELPAVLENIAAQLRADIRHGSN